MPLHPKEDPPLDSFGPIEDLPSIPIDEVQPSLKHILPRGPKDCTTIPLSQGSVPLVYGGGVWGQGMYNDDDLIKSTMPIRTLRLAFQYGINTIDTSPYYYPSEFILGKSLETLSSEWPRNTYYLCTKVGRYGPNVSNFDYSSNNIKASVEKSLKRLRTSYLDLVYLHDVEFVAEKVGKSQDEGWDAFNATTDEHVRNSLGLDSKDVGKIYGPGDELVLAAAKTLFDLKDQGKIRAVGISGYPLPVLVRISRLIETRHHRPLDAILSYSNHTLHSDILPTYIDTFFNKSTPPLILNGSPFSMGLLTDNPPPTWHPASDELKQACVKSSTEIRSQDQTTNLAQVALTFGIRGAEDAANPLRTLLGMSDINHVHAAIMAYKVLSDKSTSEYKRQVEMEMLVKRNVQDVGAYGWSWASPPKDALR